MLKLLDRNSLKVFESVQQKTVTKSIYLQMFKMFSNRFVLNKAFSSLKNSTNFKIKEKFCLFLNPAYNFL